MKKIIYEKPVENNPFVDRECPKWFRDAKVGIFIHWGPYSVPGWAPTNVHNPITEAFEVLQWDIDSINLLLGGLNNLILNLVLKGQFRIIKKFLGIMNSNPYAEWYWNSMAGKSPTREFHKQTYGDKKYEEFGPEFNEATRDWNPDTWTELFEEAGAQYVITTSKHHDGFCLWPTEIENPNIPNWHSTRDLLGDLKDSLSRKNVRLALYFSGGLDWSLCGVPISINVADSISQSEEAIEYFDGQRKEIIDRYLPSLIWEDIGYPENGDFHAALEYYYKVVPDGVVNDRAQTRKGDKATRHFDYTTTEYFVPQSIREVPWEICRGVTESFGYNQQDNDETTISVEELVESLADVVSKNGNMLIGLGPRADGSFPENQVKLVKQFGQWMKVNSEAIYGTRPYQKFSDETNTGNQVRYTTKGDSLYAIIIGSVEGEIRINGLNINEAADVELLGSGKLERINGGVLIETPTDKSACVLKIDMNQITS